jgi:folate-dependent phosphoribosylglycinamide formyltransferase PurN
MLWDGSRRAPGCRDAKEVSGCTIHQVTESVDGGYCCAGRVQVEAGDTAESLKVSVKRKVPFIRAIEVPPRGHKLYRRRC